MQHEILFRAKRIDNGKWVEGWYCKYAFRGWPLEACIIPASEAENGCLEHVEVDPNTIGWFTGLLDQNGARIFEGDIVQSLNQVYDTDWIVVYEDGKYLADNINMPWIEDLIDVVMGNCVVIGNRFENPELLEVEN